MQNLKNIVGYLAQPYILHYTLPFIIIYIIAGTIAQKYIGLYDATQIYFSSFIFWLGPIPLPGMPAFFALITLSLMLKLILRSPWSLSKAGIITTHISALLLLAGGFFTLTSSEEGYIDLVEGSKKSTISDYHIREFVVLDEHDQVLESVSHAEIQEGQIISFQRVPLEIIVVQQCRNCKITARESEDRYTYMGLAQHMQLSNAPLSNEDETNMAGLSFIVTNGHSNEVFLVLEGVPKYPQFDLDGQEYKLALLKQQRALPFTVELVDFKKDLHPGTAMAKAYQSRVRIYDQGAQWESLISMNNPLRYKGYTLYQSSFLETPDGEISVLSVVHNTGRVFPYVSGVIMCLGLLLHLWLRKRQFKPVKVQNKLAALSSAIIFCFLFLTSPAEAYDFQYFSQTPILHEGRIKPMKSFAIAEYKQLSGEDDQALEWLVEMLFNPANMENRPIIKIRNMEVLITLGLEKRSDKRYSHQELAKALADKQDIVLSIIQSPEGQWTAAQKDLIAVQENVVLFEDLLSSLTVFLPINLVLHEDLPEQFAPYAGKVLTYSDVLKFQESLKNELKKVLKEKGQQIDKFSKSEQDLTFLSFAAENLRINGEKSQIFRIIPIENSQEWKAPWAYINSGAGHPRTAALFEKWKNLALAYHAQDEAAWARISKEIYNETIRLAGSDLRSSALKAEFFYVSYEPYQISIIFYSLALLFLVLSNFRPLEIWASIALGAGALTHMIALGLRIYILERPPVSTLYESILFVALICVFYSLWSFFQKREQKWLYIGASLGLCLHLVGFSQNTTGDSMLMLSAVLNTNFWLATHVVCITIGYAFCLLTSVLAHYELGMGYLKCEAKLITNERFRAVHTLALLALLFTAVGTILGGIWADQSWGRFWGWDPKENGALFIVLWLIWLLHARVSAILNTQYVTIGLAYLSVIVSLSWFGVNLLSVGLHSYGFTEGMVWSLGIFIALETILAAMMIIKTHQRDLEHNVA